ncbi:3-phosphoserine/phosphohydroxythreonine transaminase [Acidithiobacillus sp. AMEEHan]|uniref:3-phosphoserine/phosphohydroxythreonine transaminase n=1 Tax=Acidithiobacillus sp. AMEEHan TaxID=2994951 RepID=UPI0027E42A71|nr:3-phosphoserine/phosphohydroxythreonine transaminase [Acidithiobacillus sp. AMEEHan]
MHQEIYNFSAGPAVLPKPVLAQVQEELPDWHGSGMSVMEMSHRGPEYMGIIAQAEADLRALLAIPENYRVLFLQGGASQQFAMVPMNLLAGGRAAYVETGIWSRKASSEAKRFGEIDVIASNAGVAGHAVPRQESWQLRPEHRYCHIADNETVDGIEFDFVPELGEVPLVSDASSNILSKPLDVSRFALIYAGAQKNVGPAGLTLVIIRDDLLGQAGADVPTMLNYAVHAEHDSMYNTPPTFAIYVAGLVFRWLLQQGGLPAMAEINARKAAALYAAIDGSGGFYRNDVAVANRSRMNVPFFLHDPALDAVFLREAGERGLLQLKGHRLLGGMRASIYNAMPEAGVWALVDFLHDFARRHG